jgi:type IV pilus assembly protein PilA
MLKSFKILKENKNRSSEEGFTLIELMIVVVIIGVLAAIAIPIFANQQKAAIEAAVKSDIKGLATAIQTTATKNNKLAMTFEASVSNKQIYEEANTVNFLICYTDTEYAVVAKNPQTDNAYSYNSKTGKLQTFTSSFPASYSSVCPVLGFEATNPNLRSSWGYNPSGNGWASYVK